MSPYAALTRLYTYSPYLASVLKQDDHAELERALRDLVEDFSSTRLLIVDEKDRYDLERAETAVWEKAKTYVDGVEAGYRARTAFAALSEEESVGDAEEESEEGVFSSRRRLTTYEIDRWYLEQAERTGRKIASMYVDKVEADYRARTTFLASSEGEPPTALVATGLHEGRTATDAGMHRLSPTRAVLNGELDDISEESEYGLAFEEVSDEATNVGEERKETEKIGLNSSGEGGIDSIVESSAALIAANHIDPFADHAWYDVESNDDDEEEIIDRGGATPSSWITESDANLDADEGSVVETRQPEPESPEPEPPAPGAPETCTICDREFHNEDWPSPDVNTCHHNSSACLPCWQQWLDVQVSEKRPEQITCILCPEVLSQFSIRHLAMPATFDKYLDAELKILLSADPDFKWCPAPNCNSGQVHSEGYIFTCAQCEHRSCTECEVAWHEGLTCDQYKAKLEWDRGAPERERKEAEARREREIREGEARRKKEDETKRKHEEDARRRREEEARKKREDEARRKREEDLSTQKLTQMSKLCPGCTRKLEKTDGCDHMTCTMCRHQFCWSCLADYDQIRKHGNGYHKYSCTHYA